MLIALINGYFCFCLLTHSMNTNLPKSIEIQEPIVAPIHTERKPTSIALSVVLYAYLKATPAPRVRILPGTKSIEQTTYKHVSTNGP